MCVFPKAASIFIDLFFTNTHHKIATNTVLVFKRKNNKHMMSILLIFLKKELIEKNKRDFTLRYGLMEITILKMEI